MENPITRLMKETVDKMDKVEEVPVPDEANFYMEVPKPVLRDPSMCKTCKKSIKKAPFCHCD